MLFYCQFGRLFTVLLLLSISGCSVIGEQDYQYSVENSPANYQKWRHQQNETVQVSLLTDLIAIDELNDLVLLAMDKNPSLQQTAAALQISYAQRGIAASERIPHLSAGLNADNKKDSDTTYSADLTVSWEIDLWQKISDSVSAAEMDIKSSEMTYQSARDVLAANVMRSWLQINLSQQLLEIEKQRLTALENNEISIVERYRAGLGELEELDSARSSSAKTRAALVDYAEQLAQKQRSLQLLLGQNPQSDNIQISAEFPAVSAPLTNLPEQDLGRRPDLQSAYYNILANQYRTDIAYKALLPSISLSASLSSLAAAPSDVLFGSGAWSLLGQLTAPLFQGGKLRSEIEIAQLSAEQSYWLYQETLLNAVNEVENALGQELSLTRQQEHLNEALSSAQTNFANYQVKYRQGLVDILDLLAVQQQTFDLQSQLIEVTYLQLNNRIDLGLALGLGVSS
ncbi:TolC family protein [Psychromonas aquimarina]|uniref:TolC family protein n=1 Tax=Psychromonas aquimarina TaxID=444919 RepID=UPI00041F0A4C|nr:TolC family protein [Psychromonas aquimarina]